MTAPVQQEPARQSSSGAGRNRIEPLPGEAGIPSVTRPVDVTFSVKRLVGTATFVLTVFVALTAWAVHHFDSNKKPEDQNAKSAGDRPAAASLETRRLDMTVALAASAPAASSAASSPALRIPALIPTADDAVEPIAVRRTASTPSTPNSAKPIVPPEDAPSLLVSTRPDSTSRGGALVPSPGADPSSTEPIDRTRRNLDAYQHQLQGMLDTLSKSTAAATGSTPASTAPGIAGTGTPSMASAHPAGQAPALGGLFGGQLQASATPRVSARLIGDRSLILPKGTAFTCALKTKVISAASGLVGCQVQRNVYSDDGRVLLIERGSHLDGEYRVTSVRPGTVRIPVLWTRIRTPNGVTVDIDSPGTGPLGESGIDGYVDNRWGERIGAAMLLSLIDDSVSLLLQRESNGPQGNTILLPSTTASTSKLAEKVLDSTINIPPLIYQNQGGIVGIYVARDVDFSTVYELKPVAP